MVKIAVISPAFPPKSFGGIATAQHGLVKFFSEQKEYEVKGFTFNSLEDKKASEEKNIYNSGTPMILQKVIRWFLLLVFKILDRGSQSYQLADILCSSFGSLITAYKLRKYSPDIVIASDHCAPLCFIAPFVNAKFIWCAHHIPSRFANNPIVGKASIKDINAAVFFENIGIKYCSSVVASSEYTAEMFKSTYQLGGQQVHVVKNLIDIEFLNSVQPHEDYSGSFDGIKVFFPSVGSPIKGERYALSIIQNLQSSLPDKSIQFVLSGTPSEMLRYELSKSSNINYKLAGLNPYSTNLSILKACDICISPTLMENFGMAILEATLLGIPTVAFDVGGNRALIENGKNGYLVNYPNLDELCQKARLLIEESFSKSIVQKVSVDNYALNEVEKSWNNIIKGVLSDQKSRG